MKALPLLSLLLLLPATGCPTTAPPRAPLQHTLTREAVIALVNHNAREAASLQDNRASVSIREPGKDSFREFDARILFAHGGRLAMHLDSGVPLLPTGDLYSDGRTVWIRTGSDYFTGPVSRLNRVTRSGQLLIPRPEDLVSALALEPIDPGRVIVTVVEAIDRVVEDRFEEVEEIEPPAPDPAGAAPPAADPAAEGQTRKKRLRRFKGWRPVYRVSLMEQDYGQTFLIKAYLIDRTTLQRVRQQVYNRSGQVVMDVHYSDWRKVESGKLILPHRVQIDWPLIDSALSLEFNKAKLNLPLIDNRFNFPIITNLGDDIDWRPLSP